MGLTRLHDKEKEAALGLLSSPSQATLARRLLEATQDDEELLKEVRTLLAFSLYYTAKQAAQQLPTQQPPRDPASPRRSHSRTVPRHSRTPEKVVDWLEFDGEVSTFVQRLDDEYFVIPARDLGVTEMSEAAKEGHVEAPLMTSVAKVANLLAESLGSRANLVSGGSGRSSSDTDEVVAAKPLLGQERTDPSSAVLADVEAKGGWQLLLQRGDSVVVLMNDERDHKKVAAAVQQLFGDMIEDEAAFGALTTYFATVFLRRHHNVADKTLFCSRIFWQDEQSPTAFAAWATFLYICWRDRDLKGGLKREKVPITPEKGYPYEVRLPPTKRGRMRQPKIFHQKATSSNTPSKGKRKHEAVDAGEEVEGGQEAFAGGEEVERGREPEGGDAEGGQEPRGEESQRGEDDRGGREWTQWGGESQRGGQEPAGGGEAEWGRKAERRDAEGGQEPEGADDDWGRGPEGGDAEGGRKAEEREAEGDEAGMKVELKVVPYQEIGFTPKIVACGRNGNICWGSIGGERVAVKKFEPRRPQATEALKLELLVYKSAEFQSLQGETIPRLKSCGLLPHTLVPFLALSYEGEPLKHVRMTRSIIDRATSALERFHAAGLLHGDLNLNNFLVKDGKVILCDFETVRLDALPQEQKKERDAFLELLNKVSA
ncbi:hypothetical protein KFL_001560150 [Klebsormidium nitens]|uniref:Protein kinase domain-containing protein n=1 Tax=Klebsormidium nitens TaxID=105231 RepID=A0A1Y1I4J9_KLENI|nr:hypothetical protein KFL_001560150 [Klebsormidium nitens]|eukprot:GAQ83646.1 hypothetical protein KFL_001560150 [Klebsormidium nitens]